MEGGDGYEDLESKCGQVAVRPLMLQPLASRVTHHLLQAWTT